MSKTMSKTTTKKERCCFAGCRTLIRDYGNNPRPCYTSGRCCDHCNSKVIEERWIAIQKSVASPPHTMPTMVHVAGATNQLIIQALENVYGNGDLHFANMEAYLAAEVDAKV